MRANFNIGDKVRVKFKSCWAVGRVVGVNLNSLDLHVISQDGSFSKSLPFPVEWCSIMAIDCPEYIKNEL